MDREGAGKAGDGEGGVEDARIVFMGTPVFAATILEGLLGDGWKVVGVVSQPDRPRGRGRKVVPSPVSEVARQAGIPLLQPVRLREPGFLEALSELAPDLIVVAAYGRILPPEVLSLPRLGCYNVHASLLPAYRGASPIQWAIIRGETRTGITIFRMDEGMDTGDVLASEALEIEPGETAGALSERLARLAVRILTPALREVVSGRARLLPQEETGAGYAPLLKKSDGKIDWSLPAESIRNRIRGLDPWPGAFTTWRGRRLRVWEAEVEPGGGRGGEPGEILSVEGGKVRVQTGEGILRLESVQLEGGKRMPVDRFLRGNRMEAGERLG